LAKPAIRQIATYSALEAAWRYLLANARPASRNTRGVDNVSINDFAVDHKYRLRVLARDLAAGEFVFSPLRPHLIPKANGKDRLICVPTVRDRVVQRALLDLLTRKYLARISNAISYGFVRNRRVQDAAVLACQHRKLLPWVFKTDITSFFDKIQRKQLMAETARFVRLRSLHKLLGQAANCEIGPTSGSAGSRITKLGIEVGLGVRQGMPLSPFFANVMLDKFDRAVIAAGYTAIRYADDLIFFAASETACHEIHAFCKQRLGEIGLSVPDIAAKSKSEIYPPGAPAEFLGLGLCEQHGHYVLKLMPSQIEKIKNELMHLSSIPELLGRKITLANLASNIQNRTAGYLNAYDGCSNAEELENEFADLTQKVLRKLYGEGLKIDLQTLTQEKRTFLGLT
jgi:RNA-directed DNA polymerase